MTDLFASQHVPAPATARPARSKPASPSAPVGTLTHHRLDQVSVTPPVRVQAELTIGAPDDKYEREADEVADAVMRMPDAGSGAPSIQRMCAGCEEDEQIRQSPLGADVRPAELQRMDLAGEEEEEALQASPIASGVVASASGGLVASGEASARVAAARQGGTPLSASDRSFFEPRLAHDLSAVRVHTGPAASQAAASVGARAFTVGPDIVVGGGQPRPSTPAGKRLFAHELVHVVQQGHASSRRLGEEG